jgi:anti-sigma regulatory factor (Ser/Thr protein kinase)
LKRELSLAPELDSVGRLAEIVAEVSAADEWTPDLEYKVSLAVEEIGMNIVSYASLPNDQLIEVSIDSNPDSVTVMFSDAGPAFNPFEDAPAPDLDASVADRRIGGLGIHLVETLMESVSYSRGGGRNNLTMVANRAK